MRILVKIFLLDLLVNYNAADATTTAVSLIGTDADE
jgi:hypothetical protein